MSCTKESPLRCLLSEVETYSTEAHRLIRSAQGSDEKFKEIQKCFEQIHRLFNEKYREAIEHTGYVQGCIASLNIDGEFEIMQKSKSTDKTSLINQFGIELPQPEKERKIVLGIEKTKSQTGIGLLSPNIYGDLLAYQNSNLTKEEKEGGFLFIPSAEISLWCAIFVLVRLNEEDRNELIQGTQKVQIQGTPSAWHALHYLGFLRTTTAQGSKSVSPFSNRWEELDNWIKQEEGKNVSSFLQSLYPDRKEELINEFVGHCKNLVENISKFDSSDSFFSACKKLKEEFEKYINLPTNPFDPVNLGHNDSHNNEKLFPRFNVRGESLVRSYDPEPRSLVLYPKSLYYDNHEPPRPHISTYFIGTYHVPNIEEYKKKQSEHELFQRALDHVAALYETWNQSSVRASLHQKRQIALDHASHAAVAAILSRNLSHNIGSHSLSRLSRNPQACAWYTASYLLQRMDFIAQACSEWPLWTAPAYFLQDIMRWFLTQKEILDTIAASELVRVLCYPPQSDPSSSASARVDGTKTKSRILRFHAFLVPRDCWNGDPHDPPAQEAKAKDAVLARIKQIRQHCNQKNDSLLPCRHGESRPADDELTDCQRILLYSDLKNHSVRTDNDFQLAVPGGIVGQHAFYTILENCLRNTAKHSQKNQDSDTLDIVIEVLFDPDQQMICRREGSSSSVPAFLFRIYDNLSDPSIVEHINNLLRLDILDEVSGSLKREAWGIAEMKIAAAFLQTRAIPHIARGKTLITGRLSDDPTPMTSKDESASGKGYDFIIRATKSPVNTLAYEFPLLRPQILIAPVPPEVSLNDQT